MSRLNVANFRHPDATADAITLTNGGDTQINRALGLGGATYGTSGQVLTSAGSGAVPTWTTPDAGLSYTSSVVNVSSSTGTTFTSIPTDVRQIRISYQQLSTNGTNRFKLQLGDSGGLETSGYAHTLTYHGGSQSATTYTDDSGFSSAGWTGGTNFYNGYYLINRLAIQSATSNVIYMCDNYFGLYNGSYSSQDHGYKTLSGQLTQVRLMTDDGTTNFDSGIVRIDYLS